MNELEYCNKWNIVYIIKFSNRFMFDTIFRFNNISGVKKYPIKSEKAWRHIIFLFHFAQNTSLNKFRNFKQVLITISIFKNCIDVP